ncbi:hypothetical protein JYK21_08170 [Ralstonia pickettii]|nr:hypothetical protein [Ralstonia pickettii]
MKKILMIAACLLLVLPAIPTVAVSNEETAAAETEGELASKDEVVYATLDPNGKSQELYIVNTLDVTEAGKITDYGNYTTLKNLTDLSEIELADEKVELTAPEGKFYYQGNMEKSTLPWNFEIKYFLDGDEIAPKELAGKDGHLEIKINTAKNEKVDSVFYENYLLQIAFALDSEKASNIKSEEGMLANAGKNKQVTFTVMPEQDGELAAEADVVDFELSGIDITAVPSTISVDAPDTDELTSDMVTLSDAIGKINNGVAELKDGAVQLNAGTTELKNGSAEYRNGITALHGGSSELVSGSEAIDHALQTMSDSLSAIDDIDLSELELLMDGLAQLSAGLKETSAGLSQLHENYTAAYKALNDVINAIPEHQVTQEEIEALYRSGADQETLNKLVEVYQAALTAKGTYNQIKEAFSAVDSTLETVIASLNTMAENVDTMVNEVSDSLDDINLTEGLGALEEGIAALAGNYAAFHTGLIEYTDGVGELANGYQELDNGIAGLSEGTADLETGIGTLHEGTSELAEATSEIPEQMTEEIDKMISEYDKSDFEAVSFVSMQNENVNSVQFVLKTESIEYDEPEAEDEDVKQEKSLWQKFLDLFS